jgi:cytidylate kinase
MGKTSRLIIAISRQLGAGGSIVGQGVAGRLGIRYLDRGILDEAARRLNEPAETLESVEEKGLTFGERFMNVFAAGTLEAGLLSLPPRYDREVIAVESEIIRRVADEFDCVIVGRGGSVILRDLPGLLRVFLHAPLDFRIAQIRARHPEIAPDEIPGAIRRSDRDRSLFRKMLSELEWSDARQYDLSIDTGSIGMKAAEEIVVRAAETIRGRLPE